VRQLEVSELWESRRNDAVGWAAKRDVDAMALSHDLKRCQPCKQWLSTMEFTRGAKRCRDCASVIRRARRKRESDEIADRHVSKVLWGSNGVRYADATQEMIEMKREQIKTNRLIKQRRGQ
jgi:hypothetical protein